METKVQRYKRFLIYTLITSIITLVITGYFYCYSKVPSQLKIRAGMEQTLEFGIPVTGEFKKKQEYPEAVTVSEQPGSNVPSGIVNMELSDSVTLCAMQTEVYDLQLKLFGMIPLKEVEVEVIDDEALIPAGIPIGIYVKTEGVLVVGIGEFNGQDGGKRAPSRYLLKTGDYILKVNGQDVLSKADFMERVGQSAGEELILTVCREGETFEVKTKPLLNENGEYKLGIWIRDNAQGIGTLTFIDNEGNFGALGHGINDVDTSKLLELDSGTLYHTDIISIRKGVSGTPGEMTGLIDYDQKNILGDITVNSVEGIFGKSNEALRCQLNEQALPIALKQELRKGPAQILCTVEGYTEAYDVEITGLNLDHDNVNRGITLEITDERLLEQTGGIVQGMSGAPIIQDGKLAGAVTHVLVQDATKGYGIFIENMLKN